MDYLILFIFISLHYVAIAHLQEFKINRDHIENIKQISNFKIIDYDHHPFKDWTFNELKTLFGSSDQVKFEMNKNKNTLLFLDNDETVPTRNYDIRSIQPECTFPIRRQYRCASCWAMVTAQMLSYKICLKTNGRVKVNLSPQDLISCSH